MIVDKTFKKVNYTKNPLAKDEYEGCAFIDCIFSNTDLSSISFVECEFIGCDLSSSKIYDTVFNEVVFDNCKILGLAFDKANTFTFSATFKDCQLDFTTFYKRNLKNQRFMDCSLKEVDFTETILNNAKFVNCNLENAIFDNTDLEKVDFTTAYNYVFDPEKNRIKNAKFSKDGIVGLLQKYQVVVS